MIRVGIPRKYKPTKLSEHPKPQKIGPTKITSHMVHYQCYILCTAQWQKSPGVFMRKNDEKFTIENGSYIKIQCM